jgi:hypothetical protein
MDGSALFAIWQKLSFIQRVIAADTQYHLSFSISLSLSLSIHKHTQMKERERERRGE